MTKIYRMYGIRRLDGAMAHYDAMGVFWPPQNIPA